MVFALLLGRKYTRTEVVNSQITLIRVYIPSALLDQALLVERNKLNILLDSRLYQTFGLFRRFQTEQNNRSV